MTMQKPDPGRVANGPSAVPHTQPKLGAAREQPSNIRRGPRDLTPILDKVRPFTMVPEPSLVELARQVQATIQCGIPGHFVECGVWRGGTSFLMASLLQQAGVRDRKVWLFDSFEG